MQNPYEVLGVKEGASDAEIKAAYRELVKKYHPDKYQGNPLGDLAKEKMQEINEAYDFLTNKGGAKKHGGFGGRSGAGAGAGGYGGASGYSGVNTRYSDIRRDIDRGDVRTAESKLQGIMDRDAEWFFLNGMVQYRKGWFDQAVSSIQTSVSMNPGNMEYRNTLNQIMASRGGYAQGGYQRGYNDASTQMCQCMSCMCCADMCCDGF
jgi:molecular chaperone DnaJ